MGLFKKKEEKPLKEFKEADYDKDLEEDTDAEETSEPIESEEEQEEPQEVPKINKVSKKIEETKVSKEGTKLTEQDILALGKWHIARGFELLNLLN